MAYKHKPKKAVVKRIKVTATGKLKRGSGKRSHLMSNRDAKTRRQLRKGGIVAPGHSKNLRRFLGTEAKRPGTIAHERRLRDAEGVEVEGGELAAAGAPVAAAGSKAKK